MAAAAATTGDRFDVFVGNVRDSTTEEQLQSVFSVVGTIIARVFLFSCIFSHLLTIVVSSSPFLPSCYHHLPFYHPFIIIYLGPVKKVRILIDQDTGRPKGFAFVEYHDANTALAAIRHLDGHELNSRRLRVSYSNNSNLKEVAQTISSEQIPNFSHLRPEFHAVSGISKHAGNHMIFFRFTYSYSCTDCYFEPQLHT